MAKRFTDTGKWEKAWFRKLSPKMKCVWIFLCDKCDHAGVWELDAESFAYFIGEEVSVNELENVFGDRIEIISGEKIFIKSFIDFQYGQLNPSNRVHQSVLSRLQKISKNKPLLSPLQGAKDKDKDKDKDKEKEKEFSPSPLSFLFDARPDIQAWLNLGNHETHSVILAREKSHHEIFEIIEKAFNWAQPKSKRADSWVLTFFDNKKPSGFGANLAQESKTPITPDNLTGNPYKAKLAKLRSEGKLA